MTFAEKHIIETYSGLFHGLSVEGKTALINKLTESLNSNKKTIDDDFYASFGALESELTAEEMIVEIKKSRKFRKKDVSF